MKYMVMHSGACYRIFREDEVDSLLSVNTIFSWEVVHGPGELEEIKELCIQELSLQIESAKEEIADAEEYTGEKRLK